MQIAEPELQLKLDPPPNLDLSRWYDLNIYAFANKEYRIAKMRRDPLLFGLYYFGHHLRARGSNRITLAEYHVDMAESALRWCWPNPSEREVRDSWTVPRDGGKTTWNGLILPLWSLAYSYSHFWVQFSLSTDLAKINMRDTVKNELATNAKLRRDFPSLCNSMKTVSRGGADTNLSHYAASGQTIMALGMDRAKLGLKVGNSRPDLITLDDIQPEEAQYSMAEREKRLASLLHAILPMNVRARVAVSGTTVMYGCIMHDLVNAACGEKPAKWIVEQNFQPHYYPAIVSDAQGVERSIWPAKWSLQFLNGIRNSADYAINYDNRPKSSGDPYWTEGMFQHDWRGRIEERTMVLDFAVTDGPKSDYTALVVGGADPYTENVLVEFALALRQHPEALRETVGDLLRDNPSITRVIAETTQGGDTWHTILAPVLGHAKWDERKPSASKRIRARKASNYYSYRWVWHDAERCAKLEQQMCAFPNVHNDDLVDAVGYLVDYHLADRTMPGA